MTSALIIPAVGTVVLCEDGSVKFTNRDRVTSEISAEIVRTIVRLVRAKESGDLDHAD